MLFVLLFLTCVVCIEPIENGCVVRIITFVVMLFVHTAGIYGHMKLAIACCIALYKVPLQSYPSHIQISV